MCMGFQNLNKEKRRTTHTYVQSICFYIIIALFVMENSVGNYHKNLKCHLNLTKFRYRIQMIFKKT